MKKKPYYYYCKHCGTKWTTKYLADLCFETDMEEINKPKKPKENENLQRMHKTSKKRI